MDLTIPKSLEALVRERIVKGHLQACDEAVKNKRARFKDAIDRGDEDVTTGP
jgi:hypothetical protein